MQTERIQIANKVGVSRRSTLTVILFVALMVASALAGKMANMALPAAMTAVLFLVVTFSAWYKKSSARSGLLILICSSAMLALTNRFADVNLPEIFTRYFDVILLLAGIALLRQVMASLNFSSILGGYLLQRKSSGMTLSMTFLTAFLTWPMSLGAIPLLLDSLKSVVGPTFNLAKIVTRTVCITMVLMPTTIGAAAVWAAMPEVAHFNAMLIGIPLFLFSIALNQSARLELVTQKNITQANRGDVKRILLFCGLFWGIFIFSLLVLKFNALQSIAATAVVLFIVEKKFGNKSAWTEQLTEAVEGISGEVLLLLGCSLLTTVCWLFFSHLPGGLTAFVSGLTTIQIYAIILFIVPLFGLAGIHPLIVFSVAWSVFSDFLPGGIVDYQIWICLFIATQLISPVSINAIFAANSLNVSPNRTSFQMHYGYVLCFNLFALIYLSALSKIIS